MCICLIIIYLLGVAGCNATPGAADARFAYSVREYSSLPSAADSDEWMWNQFAIKYKHSGGHFTGDEWQLQTAKSIEWLLSRPDVPAECKSMAPRIIESIKKELEGVALVPIEYVLVKVSGVFYLAVVSNWEYMDTGKVLTIPTRLRNGVIVEEPAPSKTPLKQDRRVNMLGHIRADLYDLKKIRLVASTSCD